MTRFTGIWVPLVTPFKHGEVDLFALQAIARRIAEAGVAGLVVCGSTGEAAALDINEQLMVLDTVLDAVPDCPVVMGLSGANVAALLAMQRQVQQRPLSGLLVPPPSFIRPSQQGLVQYFRLLAEAASVPLIVYNIPYRTGVAIELDTMRTIARHERVVAVKDCSGDQGMTMQLIADSKLAILAGEDQQIFSMLCLGASGAIAASAHIRPDLFVSMAQLLQSGELDAARKIFYRLLPMIRLLFEEPNPAPLKTALAMMGLMRNELRVSMEIATEPMKERIAHQLKRLDCC